MVPVVCLSAGALAVFLLAVKATSKYCDDGHICSPPRECCASGCCHGYSGGIPPPSIATDRQHILTVISWNHWYFWFLLLFLLVSCLLGGCGWLRRRRLSECRCCCCCWSPMESRASDSEDEDDDDEGEGGWHTQGTPSRHSPPPYSEVTSKPDLYPLVISVGGGNKSPVSMSGSNNGGYLMVHFFRNYFVRPVGSLSATSTVDSLSSSFLCSAANEANTLIPPPYPCEEEDEEVAEERTEEAASWSQAEELRLAFSGSEVSSLGLGTPCSPPRATTPTPGLSSAQPSEELRDLVDKIQRLPGAGGKRRTSTGGKRMTGQRRGSGWLLLGPSGGKVVGGAGTRSAPTTPSTHFAPGLFRPASVTRGSPLLSSASSSHEEEAAVQEEEGSS